MLLLIKSTEVFFCKCLIDLYEKIPKKTDTMKRIKPNFKLNSKNAKDIIDKSEVINNKIKDKV